MTKGYQRSRGGLKWIAVKPATYDKLLALGKMKDSFADVISEIMTKAEISGIIPEYEGGKLSND